MKKYIVVKDRIGRYVWLPIEIGPYDCCGFVRWIGGKLNARNDRESWRYGQ